MVSHTEAVFAASATAASCTMTAPVTEVPSPPPPPPPPTPLPQGSGLGAGGAGGDAPQPRRRCRHLSVTPPPECARCGEDAERDIVCGVCGEHVCQDCRLPCAHCAALFCLGCLSEHACVNPVVANDMVEPGEDPSGRDGFTDDSNNEAWLTQTDTGDKTKNLTSGI